jgi:PAS domain S-box-containing protein
MGAVGRPKAGRPPKDAIGNDRNNRGAMALGHLLRLFTVFSLIFAGLWGVHTAVLLQTAKRYWGEETSRRLMVMSQAIEADILENSSAAMSGPEYLRTLAERYGALGISILNRDGHPLVDTLIRGTTNPSESYEPTAPFPIDPVWNGMNVMTDPYPDSSGGLRRSYFTPLRDSQQKMIGALKVDLRARTLESGGGAATALLLKVAGAVMLVVLGYYSVRTVIRRQRFPARPGGPLDETSSMITTFHERVRQLKDKEAELERSRAQAEQRAEEIESYNENILQSVTSGVITFNPDHVITTFNHTAERILGLSSSEAVGKSCEEVFGSQSNIVQLLDQALSRQSTITRQELRIARPSREKLDSRRIWVGVSTSLLRDHHDALIGTTFVFTDLTEIKSLQEQIELKRRLTVLGEMSAGIAHEFRNYMGSVMGFAKLLSKKLPASGGADSGQEMIESIMRELSAMNQLIEQLLSFGRHAELHLEPVALEPLIRRLLDHLIAPIEGTKPRVVFSFPPVFPEVRMDEVLMRQALGNLFQNAIEAMPQGGELQVRAAVLERSDPAGTGRHQKELWLEIRDAGVGIPKDKLDKIFLPFFTTKEKGTGMGLALVHKIVLSHGGRLEVDSLESRGTTFRIYLPMSDVA